MQFSLVFAKSGDSIKFNTSNTELVKYYFDELNTSDKNKFNIYSLDFISNITRLEKCVSDIDNFLKSKLKLNNFSEFANTDLYNRQILNKLHCVWVKFQLDNPKIVTLFAKIGNESIEKFRDINNIIHKLEWTKYNISNFTKDDMWSCDNIFKNKIIDFNIHNLNIKFNNLGRSTYDKWRVNDNNVYDSDTNDYTSLSGELMLSTGKCYTQSPPKEYIEWCTTKGIEIVGKNIGLGNFVESIENAQAVLYRNMKIGSTTVTIQI